MPVLMWKIMLNSYYMFGFFSFLFGAIVGSFLNVCIARIPLKESIVSPPSHCPRCNYQIRFYGNIPILSYIFLLGRCRKCREKISIRYPMVELIVALLSLALFWRYGLSLSYPVYFVFASALVVITFIDLDHRIIPDVISLPGIVVGFAASFLLYEVSWLESLLGILVGGGTLLLVAVIYESLTGVEGMGGGDIKLLAMLGAFLGWKAVLFIIMASSLLGTVIGGALIIIKGKDGKFAIPFGPFLSLGALIFLFWGNTLIDWYLGFFEYGRI